MFQYPNYYYLPQWCMHILSLCLYSDSKEIVQNYIILYNFGAVQYIYRISSNTMVSFVQYTIVLANLFLLH
jgi:hypothetical protein